MKTQENYYHYFCSQTSVEANELRGGLSSPTTINLSSLTFDTELPEFQELPAISLPFEACILELAFQYMRHAKDCNACPELFPVPAKRPAADVQSSSGSLDAAEISTAPESTDERLASHCMCWSLPLEFCAETAGADARSAAAWWRSCVQLQMCADYLDLPGLARIAAKPLTRALETGTRVRNMAAKPSMQVKVNAILDRA